jgi:hypothetical protein
VGFLAQFLSKQDVLSRLCLFCRKDGHGKHTSVDNLGKGCPSELRPFLGTAIQELKSKNRLLITWPTSYGEQACVIANQTGYDFANAYNEYAHLPLMEYGKMRPKPKPAPLPPDELRKLKFPKTRGQS